MAKLGGMNGRIDRVEVGFGLFLIALGGLVLWGARSIKPAIYDNLGSAALPVTAALLVIALVGGSLVQIFRRPPEAPAETAQAHDRPLLGWGFFAVTLAFAALMGSGVMSFALTGFLYLAASGLLLARRGGRTALIVIAIAAILGFGGHHLFTRFFYIALP